MMIDSLIHNFVHLLYFNMQVDKFYEENDSTGHSSISKEDN